MSFNTSPDTKYNWDNHANADDLFVTLANEPQVIFVIFFFKKVAGNAELLKANDSLRNLLKNELVGYDEVTYTEVDLTPEKKMFAQLLKEHLHAPLTLNLQKKEWELM